MLKQVKLLGIALLVGTTLVGCEDVESTEIPEKETTKIEKDYEYENDTTKKEFDKLDAQGKHDVQFNTIYGYILESDEVNYAEDYINNYSDTMTVKEYANKKTEEKCLYVTSRVQETGNPYEIDPEQIASMCVQYVYNDIVNDQKIVEFEEKKQDEQWQKEFEESQAAFEEEVKEEQERIEAEPELVYNTMMEYATQEFGTCYIDKDAIGQNADSFYTRIYADQDYTQSIGYINIDSNYQLISIDHE